MLLDHKDNKAAEIYDKFLDTKDIRAVISHLNEDTLIHGIVCGVQFAEIAVVVRRATLRSAWRV